MNYRGTDHIGDHVKNKYNKQHALQTTNLPNKDTKYRLQIQDKNRPLFSLHY